MMKDLSSDDSISLTQEQRNRIEEIALKYLDDIENWWNDDGGFGDMSILVPSGEYHINNNVNFVSTESYGHEGNIFDEITD
jgi:hypothetical protein